VLSPLPGQVSRFTIASAGAGLRLVARRGVTLSLDYGRRLRDALATDTHGALGKGVGRLHFNLAYQL
jgi:hemolysin activation/secretion protein